MVLRNVAKTFSLDEQRQEINEIAVDLDAVNNVLANWNGTQWDSAYSWGDHALAGYWVDVPSDRTNWNTAYGWGDHAQAGYAPGANAGNWDTAYGWGDHSTQGYLVNGSLASVVYRAGAEFKLIAGGSQTSRPYIHLKNSTVSDLEIVGAQSDSGGVTIDSRGSGTVKLKDGGTTRLETSNVGVTVTGTLTIGSLTLPNTTGSAGQVLTSDGLGAATWEEAFSIQVSDTPPLSANPGDLWWESDSGRLKIYYQDVDTTQWVDASPPLQGGSLTLEGLSDTDLTTVAPMLGDVLTYDGTQWVSTQPAPPLTTGNFSGIFTGNVDAGVVTSDTFIKKGGTSTQYLMADGSVSDGTFTSSTGNFSGTFTGNLDAGAITTDSIVKNGGTSDQYLMADGSVSTGGGITHGSVVNNDIAIRARNGGTDLGGHSGGFAQWVKVGTSCHIWGYVSTSAGGSGNTDLAVLAFDDTNIPACSTTSGAPYGSCIGTVKFNVQGNFSNVVGAYAQARSTTYREFQLFVETQIDPGNNANSLETVTKFCAVEDIGTCAFNFDIWYQCAA